MFLLECEGKKILYTGDFRSNGRKFFQSLLNKLPKVDALITEGTNLSNNKIRKINLTEKELEKKGIELLEGNDRPVFVLMAGTNIDRIVTLYKIANATKKIVSIRYLCRSNYRYYRWKIFLILEHFLMLEYF